MERSGYRQFDGAAQPSGFGLINGFTNRICGTANDNLPGRVIVGNFNKTNVF